MRAIGPTTCNELSLEMVNPRYGDMSNANIIEKIDNRASSESCTSALSFEMAFHISDIRIQMVPVLLYNNRLGHLFKPIERLP